MTKALQSAPTENALVVRRLRGLATRSRLLDEAELRFSESGFHGASLAVIGGACGIGNAGLLHHFPSKSRLYRAVLQGLADDLEERLVRASALRTPKARLTAALHEHLKFMLDRPAGARLLLRELLDNADRLEHARALPLADFTGGMCRLIEEAQLAKVVRPGFAVVHLSQYLGALYYGLAARPTFVRLTKNPVLRGDEAWLRLVAAEATRSLLGA